YLAEACTGCHGEKLSGGQSGEPGSPPAPNLTRGGQVGRWSEADFLRAIRTGVTPAGRKLDGKYMPWPQLARLSETELRAIWMYLQSLAPVTPAAKTARS
ncbi:MAG: c-type cytochrome, partial [Gemmatimonadaceae bacterium]